MLSPLNVKPKTVSKIPQLDPNTQLASALNAFVCGITLTRVLAAYAVGLSGYAHGKYAVFTKLLSFTLMDITTERSNVN